MSAATISTSDAAGATTLAYASSVMGWGDKLKKLVGEPFNATANQDAHEWLDRCEQMATMLNIPYTQLPQALAINLSTSSYSWWTALPMVTKLNWLDVKHAFLLAFAPQVQPMTIWNLLVTLKQQPNESVATFLNREAVLATKWVRASSREVPIFARTCYIVAGVHEYLEQALRAEYRTFHWEDLGALVSALHTMEAIHLPRSRLPLPGSSSMNTTSSNGRVSNLYQQQHQVAAVGANENSSSTSALHNSNSWMG